VNQGPDSLKRKFYRYIVTLSTPVVRVGLKKKEKKNIPKKYFGECKIFMTFLFLRMFCESHPRI